IYEPGLVIENLSVANDTIVLKRILSSNEHNIDVQDAGTAFRFLVAYCAITSGKWSINGTARLRERPISQLVDALRLLGADITYLEKEGYAPLSINGKKLKANQSELDLTFVDSSQFISALLMIQPMIEGEFSIKINHKMNSKSFVKLTIILMRKMGFSVEVKGAHIRVKKERRFHGKFVRVEPDWTSFYYWYSMAHLAKDVDLCMVGLSQNNIHEEKKRLFDVGNKSLSFGENGDGLCVKKSKDNKIEFMSKLNYSQFPDLAPTFAVLLAALRAGETELMGLESLKYKECNREEALEQILGMLNCTFGLEDKSWILNAENFELKSETLFSTFDDHRMAMSIAPLALIQPILIENESVVTKSYPNFWEDLQTVGFEIEYL
ncbi:MAG: hypothetical protein KJP21_04400, partial [Bacteroidia bacterium]|nr:hypothetical protein [Bacteroidia bacterium]